ncbi:TetR/AcrR family transcriptional regulator [Paraburkholderia silvatlantica]|nr:TetR/AcrR family transcriptional regulator [Paraburkholderia silvatlantica]
MEKTDKLAATRKPRKHVATRDSDATQARILDAAKILLSQNSYESVGVREIASKADVDPALVIRYFGSKEGLFRTIASQAFGTEEFLSKGPEALPVEATRVLMEQVDDAQWRSGYDPLRLLLCSIGSATAGPIVSEYLRKDFIAQIAAALRGKHRNERAVMLAGCMVGFALIRVAQASSEGDLPQAKSLRTLLVETLTALTIDADGTR